MGDIMIIRNEDVKEVMAQIPDGHSHIRTTIKLQDGSEMILQEATVANIVRAYTSIKTHPLSSRVVLRGTRLEKRKDGYAEWQLLES
jgi:hypothetical protein